MRSGERDLVPTRAMGQKASSPFWLSNAVIYLHAIYFLIPWTPVPYFPGHLIGPYKIYVVLFVLLCAAWAVESVRFGFRKPSPAFGVVAFCFGALLSGGVLLGYMEGDPVKISAPLHQILAEAVPYADGILVWYLIRNNGWGRDEFERALKGVLWVVLVLSVESILVFYLKIPNAYSIDFRSQVFISMFTRHQVVPARLGLVLAGVGFYFFLRRGRYSYLFASFSGALMLFSTGKRVPAFALGLGVALAAVFFVKFRKRSGANGKLGSLYVFCLTPLGLALFVSVMLVAGTMARKEFFNVSNLAVGVKVRGFEYARAADVFLARPFGGGGPRRGFLYGYSGDTPSVFSAYVYGDISQSDLGTGWANRDLFRDDPLEGRVDTLHSVPFNLILDFGLSGLVLLTVMIATGLTYFFRIMLLRRHENSFAVVMPFAVIFSTSFALFISVSSTAKFYPFWLFAILLCFTRCLYREALAASGTSASA